MSCTHRQRVCASGRNSRICEFLGGTRGFSIGQSLSSRLLGFEIGGLGCRQRPRWPAAAEACQVLCRLSAGRQAKLRKRRQFGINKLAPLYIIRYAALCRVHDGRQCAATENPADLLPHRGGKRARAGPVGMPLCRPLGQGLWEVRTDLPTKRTARVLLCLCREHLIALHGFIKKTRTTPGEGIALARKRQKELEQ
jgi:hypothetical protein